MKFSPVPSGARMVAALLCGCAALSACSTFSRDGGVDTVAAAARTDLGLEVRWPRSADEPAKSRAQVVQLAARRLTAYCAALAARDSLHYAWQVKNAAQTSAELAKRMLSAGNWNRLDQARQQGFYQQALQQLAHAQLADEAARAELRRLLGIADAGTAVNLAERPPDLPHMLIGLADIEQTVLQKRIHLQIMRAEMDELARRLKLTKATRFVNVLDAGPTRVRNGPRQDPFETGFEL